MLLLNSFIYYRVWTNTPDMYNPRSNFAIEVIDDLLFCIGGEYLFCILHFCQKINRVRQYLLFSQDLLGHLLHLMWNALTKRLMNGMKRQT